MISLPGRTRGRSCTRCELTDSAEGLVAEDPGDDTAGDSAADPLRKRNFMGRCMNKVRSLIKK